MAPDLQRLVERLRLSPGDLLGLAREAACDSRVRSVDDLNRVQRAALVAVLEMLAQPIPDWEYETRFRAA